MIENRIYYISKQYINLFIIVITSSKIRIHDYITRYNINDMPLMDLKPNLKTLACYSFVKKL